MSNQHQSRRNRRQPAVFLAAVVLLPLWTACTATQPAGGLKPLTFEAIYGPGRGDFSGIHARGMKWLPDGRHFVQRRAGILQKVSAVSGEATPAYDYEAFEAVLMQHEDFDEAAAARLARRPTLLSDDYALALLKHENRLYVYRFDEKTLRRLAESDVDRELITLSPDAAHVAFVKDNNLYSINIASGVETQLTDDGGETLLNGKLDWVYQEEVYGRGQWRSYWWSEDGRHIAYLQLDQSDVPIYTLVDHLPTHPKLEPMYYPKAGDPNPIPRLGVVRSDGGKTVWVDLSEYDDTDLLIVRVGWSPDGRVVYCVQDREQHWLDLNDADPETGESRALLRETSPAWVTVFGLPHWLDDGSFLWRSARDGWPHLYHYSREADLIRRVTAGEWEVRTLHGVDTQGGWVYFSGTRDSHVETHAYRVPLGGGQIERLTESGFSHSVNPDPKFHYFIDTFSSLTTPPRVHLRGSSGGLVRVISANEAPFLDEYRLSPPQIVRVPTDRGHALNAMIIRPPNMRPWRKYPVVTFTYGGPHGSVVHNRWDGKGYVFKQLLAQRGYIVWTCDPYSAGGEGEVSAWHAYQRLGVTEVADLEASLRWLGQHENADLGRVAILGHSYGGYLVAYALTHSRMFKVGVAAAPLSDWRNYDSIYTERYMRTPENNPDGYEQSSVLSGAGDLHGRLLLVHGTLDDNVHVQNALQLGHELQQAGKEFELMLYPRNGHGLHGNRQHWLKLRLDFIERNL